MRKTKEIFMSMLVAGGILLTMPTLSHAALQANGDTPTSYGVNDWIYLVRGMQTSGGTLGLTNTIDWDANGGKYLTSDNKNLDIHMQKNTEYGAMAILSASSYGNPNIISDGETTTGNETGIKITFNGEWVSAGNITDAGNFAKAASRYKDDYRATYVAKSGDALEETKGWHISQVTTNNYQWITLERQSGLLRASMEWGAPATSIFAYYGHGDQNYVREMPAKYTHKHPTRAVVVVGSGI